MNVQIARNSDRRIQSFSFLCMLFEHYSQIIPLVMCARTPGALFVVATRVCFPLLHNFARPQIDPLLFGVAPRVDLRRLGAKLDTSRGVLEILQNDVLVCANSNP